MLQPGKVYQTKDKVRFLILAKKTRCVGSSYCFVAEKLSSGLITFFNHSGEHIVNQEWQLLVDRYKWCGCFSDGQMDEGKFVTKDELKTQYSGYYRIENDDPKTITYVTRATLESTYG